MKDLVFLWHYAVDRALGLLPWFLVAIVLGGLLQHIRMDVLTKGGLKKQGLVAAASTTVFGALTPFCACSIVPLIRSFLAAGVPVSIVMSFWVSSPAMAPEIFGLTAASFGLPVAIARLVGAVVLGIAGFYIARVLERRGLLTEVLRAPKQPATRATAVTATATVPAPAVVSTPVAAAPASARPLAVTPVAARGVVELPVVAASAGATSTATALLTAPRVAPARAAVLAALASPQPLTLEPVGDSCCGPAASTANTTSAPGRAAVLAALTGPQPLALEAVGDSCCAPATSTAAANNTAASADSCCGGAEATATGQTAADEARLPWRTLAKQGLQQVNVWDFGAGLLRDLWLLGRWMLAAIVIEALVVRFVPPTMFSHVLGGNVLLSVVIAAVLSIPLYMNGISAIPIGASLVAMGLSPAGVVTFLLAGAITTIPAMAGVKAVVHRRVFALYVGIGVLGSIVVGLAAAPFLS